MAINKEERLPKSDQNTYIAILHRKMTHELGEHITPRLDEHWEAFLNLVKPHLNPQELSNCKYVYNICDKLLLNGCISYGNYSVLLNVFRTMNHRQCIEIIEDYTLKIKEADPTNSFSLMQGRRHDTMHVSGDRFLCHCDKENTSLWEMIKVITKYETTDKKSNSSVKVVVENKIEEAKVMKRQDFRVHRSEEHEGKICVFLELISTIDSKSLVKQMKDKLVQRWIFNYSKETTEISKRNKGKFFNLRIIGKYPLSGDNTRIDAGLLSVYEKQMTKFLCRGGKAVTVHEVKLDKENNPRRNFIRFYIESERYTIAELHRIFEKYCGEDLFENVYLEDYHEENFHATWFKIDDEYKVMSELKKLLKDQEKRKQIYKVKTCRPVILPN